MKQRNIVKKHTFSFNKPKVELDKKKEQKLHPKKVKVREEME
jgi:hypothetical protein